MALIRVSALIRLNGQAGYESAARNGSRQSNHAHPVE
jgi:hypothetical protein